ncbi:MAG: DUF3999 family protein [Candidatus Acidiferrum sp.]
MSRRIPFVLLSFAALAATALSGDLPSAWRSWRYSRSVPQSNNSGPVELPLPADLLAHSGNHLADLRLIDDLGKEVPYVLFVDRGGDPLIRSTTATLRENSFVPGKFTQIVLEVQTSSVFHNTVRIDTPETDFINWVEVAASDDAHLWRIVKARAPISRFRRENLEGSQTIHYSDNASRYLRLRIFEPDHQFAVTGAAVLSYDTREPLRTSIPAAFQLDPSAPSGVTRWQTDSSADRLPVTEVDFTTTQAEFYRAVRILTSEDGKEWNFRCGGEIYRYKLGEKIEESLRVRFGEDWGPRFWRVEILNGNDTPLSDALPSMVMIPRAVHFQPEPDRSYRLLYGNDRAAAPQYDLAHIFNYKGKLVTAIVTPGAEESTSNYADPRPYTERHPNLLWLALCVAVVLLGYTAFRALRTPPAPAE